MNWTGKAVLGMILLFIGANLFLKTLGIDMSGLIGLVIAGLLIIYGYGKMKSEKGSKFLGMAIFILGVLLAIGHLHIFGGIVISAIIIYFGYRLVSRSKEKPMFTREETAAATSKMKQNDAFDEEWDQFLTKNHLKN